MTQNRIPIWTLGMTPLTSITTRTENCFPSSSRVQRLDSDESIDAIPKPPTHSSPPPRQTHTSRDCDRSAPIGRGRPSSCSSRRLSLFSGSRRMSGIVWSRTTHPWPLRSSRSSEKELGTLGACLASLVKFLVSSELGENACCNSTRSPLIALCNTYALPSVKQYQANPGAERKSRSHVSDSLIPRNTSPLISTATSQAPLLPSNATSILVARFKSGRYSCTIRSAFQPAACKPNTTRRSRSEPPIILAPAIP